MSQEWDADRYESSGRFVSEEAMDLVDILDPRPGERVLDVGCGTGHLTAEIADRGADVVGLDNAGDMLEEARGRYPGIEFVEGDVREARFEESFDAVFSNAALHWVPEAEAAAETVAAALGPEGRFVAEFGGTGNVSGIVDGLCGAIEARGYPAREHFPWYFPTIGEYATLLEGVGLEPRSVELFDRPIEMDAGERGLREWLAMFGEPFFADVPDDEREAVLADTEDRLRAEHYDADADAWTIDYVRIRLRAVVA
jgi:SAM-dependent methyltransferase